MVSTLSIVNMIISVVVIFVLPLLFFLKFRSKSGLLRTMSAGAMGFFVAQYILRLPLVNALLQNESLADIIFGNFLLYALILGVSAAFFELLFRIIILHWFLRDHQQKHHILAAGFGHGVIEAIMVVAFSYINNIMIAIMINDGRVDQLIQDGADPGVVNQIVEALTTANPWLFLVGGMERVMVIVIHVALTILAFKGLKSARRWYFWGMAFFIHAALDFMVVYMQLNNISILLIEVLVLVFAVLAVLIIKNFVQSSPTEGKMIET